MSMHNYNLIFLFLPPLINAYFLFARYLRSFPLHIYLEGKSLSNILILGPEFGGAIGLMITLANAIAVAMYVIGFCESLLDMLAQYTFDFNGIIMTRVDDIRLIGSVVMVAILGTRKYILQNFVQISKINGQAFLGVFSENFNHIRK